MWRHGLAASPGNRRRRHSRSASPCLWRHEASPRSSDRAPLRICRLPQTKHRDKGALPCSLPWETGRKRTPPNIGKCLQTSQKPPHAVEHGHVECRKRCARVPILANIAGICRLFGHIGSMLRGMSLHARIRIRAGCNLAAQPSPFAALTSIAREARGKGLPHPRQCLRVEINADARLDGPSQQMPDIPRRETIPLDDTLAPTMRLRLA